MLKYGLIGSKGRMGREIETVMQEKGYQKVYTLDIDEETRTEVPDVIIDFSLPAAFEETIKKTEEFGCSLIMGVTGLNETHLARLKTLSEKVAVVQSFNFSVGMQMMLKCTELLKEYLNDWDVEITETHHRFKKDKPSGTAIMIKEALGREVEISSLRLGNVPGDHTIYFGGLGEVVSVTHSATSRRTFAEGVLRSAEYVTGKKNGLYTFKDVVFGQK